MITCCYRQWGLKTGLFLHGGREGRAGVVWVTTTSALLVLVMTVVSVGG